MTPVFNPLILAFVKFILGTKEYKRVEVEVHAWGEHRIDALKKRRRIVNSLRIVGLKSFDWVYHLAVAAVLNK